MHTVVNGQRLEIAAEHANTPALEWLRGTAQVKASLVKWRFVCTSQVARRLASQAADGLLYACRVSSKAVEKVAAAPVPCS